MATPNGEVFEDAGVQLAVTIVERRSRVAIVFVGVEHTVQVGVFAIEDFGIHADHEAQFIERIEVGVFAAVGGIEALVGFILGTVDGQLAVGIAPIDDCGGKGGSHAGQELEHLDGGMVEVELGRFVGQVEHELGAADLPGVGVATDDPKAGVPERHRFGIVGERIRVLAREFDRSEHITEVNGGAGDGFLSHDARGAVVGCAKLEGHRMREVKGQADQAEGNPKHDDQDRAMLVLANRVGMAEQVHEPPPEVESV